MPKLAITLRKAIPALLFARFIAILGSMPADLPDATAGQTWTWIGTPNPSEKILAVFVKTELITLVNQPHREILAFGTQLYQLPTTYQQLAPEFWFSNVAALPVPAGTPPINEWYFIGESVGNPTTTFYFFPPKTPEQSQIPYSSKEVFKAYPWHDILEVLDFHEDKEFPHSTNGPNGELLVAARLQPREVFVPGGEISTRQVTDRFLSPLRFTIPRHRIPVPGSISYSFHDVNGSFPSCLHPDITIKARRSTYAKFTATDGSSPAAGTSLGQFFPATQVQTWIKHCPLDDQEQNEMGLWERSRLTVYPPPKPGEITQ